MEKLRQMFLKVQRMSLINGKDLINFGQKLTVLRLLVMMECHKNPKVVSLRMTLIATLICLQLYKTYFSEMFASDSLRKRQVTHIE